MGANGTKLLSHFSKDFLMASFLIWVEFAIKTLSSEKVNAVSETAREVYAIIPYKNCNFLNDQTRKFGPPRWCKLQHKIPHLGPPPPHLQDPTTKISNPQNNLPILKNDFYPSRLLSKIDISFF